MKLKFSVVFILVHFLIYCGCYCECEMPDCRVDITGKFIKVVSGYKGERGTFISPDTVYNIQKNSAIVDLSIFSIGPCHEIIGFGHVWCPAGYGPPILDFSFSQYSDYGHLSKNSFSNKPDEYYTISSILKDLAPNTDYNVCSWIALDYTHTDCSIDRIVIYNDVSKFTTLN